MSAAIEQLRRSALLVVAVLTVFGMTLSAGFVWDDVPLIVLNEHLSAPGAWRQALTVDFWDTSSPTDALPGYWRPIPKLSHVLLASLGQGAVPFHALNVVLHLIASLLAMAWLRRRLLASGYSPEVSGQGSLVGALLFALHPSRFEVVGWVSSSTELFFACFSLAGFLWMEQSRTRLLGLVSFSMAMFCKETALILPLLLAADAFFAGRLRGRLTSIAGAVLAVGWPLVARKWLRLSFPFAQDSASWFQRVERVLAAWAGYHQRTLVPTEATAIPSEVNPIGASVFDVPTGWLIAGVVLGLAWLVLAVLAVRSPRWRPWLSDAFWWLLPLAPVLQFVGSPNPILISDRFLYLPLLGVCAAVGRGLAVAPAPAARGLRLAFGGALLSSAVMVWLALPAFNSSIEFNARELELHPDSPLAQDNFFNTLGLTGHHLAKQALLVRLLPRPMPEYRRAKLTVGLAETWSHTLRDDEAEALRQLSAFFDALYAQRPLTVLSVGQAEWPMPQDPRFPRALLQGQEGRLYEETTFLLRARTGRSEEAIRWAAAVRGRHPSSGATLLLARLLAIEERWGEAGRILAEDGQHSPLLANHPLNGLVREGAALRPQPPLDELDFAVRRARLLGKLGAPRRARAVLAPFVQRDLGDLRLVDARVQAELDDHAFDVALSILEEARDKTGAPELTAAIGEVQAGRAAWDQNREAELRLSDPAARH